MKKKPSKFPLPEPIELAKLAAILRPEFQAAGALKVAMEFYVEAVLFCRESSSMSFEDLITRFGGDKRHLALMAEPIKEAVQAQWADTLELDPEKDDDPVRQYLARQGLRRLKKAQTVLDNFRRYYNAPLPKDTDRPYSRPSAESVIARFERVTAGRKTYAIPKFVLDHIMQYVGRHRREAKRKSWHTRKAAKTSRIKNDKKKFRKSFV